MRNLDYRFVALLPLLVGVFNWRNLL
uniref:Uncharacterized protein n=1 Tax=Ralstonia syzygii R24 TaxID=907261 RepID=G3AAA4_9RALS|nr:hypothetical protein RALSY_mp10795 [Ralstonia syzygii R24]